MKNCNEIGNRIRQLRDSRRLTQLELSKKVFVKRETVVQWETGTRDLKTEYTVKLADFFGVTCDEILRGVKAENLDVNKTLGLSDDAIEAIKKMKKDIPDGWPNYLNIILTNPNFHDVFSKVCSIGMLLSNRDDKPSSLDILVLVPFSKIGSINELFSNIMERPDMRILSSEKTNAIKEDLIARFGEGGSVISAEGSMKFMSYLAQKAFTRLLDDIVEANTTGN